MSTPPKKVSWQQRIKDKLAAKERHNIVLRILVIAALVALLAFLVWWYFWPSEAAKPSAERPAAVKPITGASPPSKPPETPPAVAATPAEVPAAPAAPAATPEAAPSAESSRSEKPAAHRTPAIQMAKKEASIGSVEKGVFHWKNPGAAPYAGSRQHAMATRERAFRKLGFPEKAVAALVKATEKPGERIRLVNGDRLAAMLSKGDVVNKTVVVDFVRPPAWNKLEYAAPAERWTVTVDEVTYTAILPDVCNNWSRGLDVTAGRAGVSAASDTCYEITFRAVPGWHVRWFIATGDSPPPPDTGCNALRQGDLPWSSWYGECDTCATNLDYVGRTLGTSPHVLGSHRYRVVKEDQVLRFGSFVTRSAVRICLEKPTGATSCGVYIWPKAWSGRIIVPIDDTLWRRSDDCPE